MKTSSRLFVQLAREETTYPFFLLYQVRESIRLIALTTPLEVWRESYPTIFLQFLVFDTWCSISTRFMFHIYIATSNSSTRLCTVSSFTVSSPKVILILRAVSAGLWSSLNS